MDALIECLAWTEEWIARERRPNAPERLLIGPSIIHTRTGLVEVAGETQRLRRKELELITCLYQNAAVTFSREELLRRVWNCESTVLTRTVDQTVATLRRKIGDNARAPRYLRTVYGIGYRLAPAG